MLYRYIIRLYVYMNLALCVHASLSGAHKQFANFKFTVKLCEVSIFFSTLRVQSSRAPLATYKEEIACENSAKNPNVIIPYTFSFFVFFSSFSW